MDGQSYRMDPRDIDMDRDGKLGSGQQGRGDGRPVLQDGPARHRHGPRRQARVGPAG